ncbi:MAG: sodium:proton antiporter [Ruminiclostridium sp.]|nr:sodium:proton antiporter [Ruminiclostridium sp.]
MEWLFLGGFCALLTASLALDFFILWALLGGYLLFFAYGLLKGHSPRDLLAMSWEGLRTVKTILFLFLLIGMITALWRASGTIPFLIYHAAGLISPAVFPLLAFLLCSVMSALTGTSFGTAATIGVICMSISQTMGLSPVLSAGAILSGAFFGDRCSPMSTSALLVAALTKTDIYDNIRLMVRTAWIPLLLTCGIYLALGLTHPEGAFSQDLLTPFARGFDLHWVTALPALVIILLSVLKCRVKITMGLSILASAILCLTLQDMGPVQLLKTALLGYTSSLPELNNLLSGGGIRSMVTPLCIVSVSSTFSGLFDGTGLLDGLKEAAHRLAGKITPFGSLFGISILTSMISCNQSLAIMLSHSLCREDFTDQDLAIGLENTVVVIAPLIPWSIAGTVPLASLGAPPEAMLAACYLYLIPLWNLVVNLKKRKKSALK